MLPLHANQISGRNQYLFFTKAPNVVVLLFLFLEVIKQKSEHSMQVAAANDTFFLFFLSRLTGRSSTPVILLRGGGGGVRYTPHFYWSMHGGGGRGMRREATARGAAEAAKDVATEEELERIMEVAAREIPRGDRVRK